jgi:hypothetical protein
MPQVAIIGQCGVGLTASWSMANNDILPVLEMSNFLLLDGIDLAKLYNFAQQTCG